ncbi:hypothetical protein [Maledivibacter halophilus]|uniref:Uncharacterized protein n=1 Tax=Maledivibacter halophilus TaxID=36842 RepID=A0A1T5IEN0_9FIRM|nr:hypothetical protein [Maledivibacter halophilus]SKC37624.1 hypothetical protein SAMN02194393_00300 [Maledivibacter halophilus]
MTLNIFKNKLALILNYIDKLKREDIPITSQRILIRTYANDLKIYLTNDMIFEMLSYNHYKNTNYQIH